MYDLILDSDCFGAHYNSKVEYCQICGAIDTCRDLTEKAEHLEAKPKSKAKSAAKVENIGTVEIATPGEPVGSFSDKTNKLVEYLASLDIFELVETKYYLNIKLNSKSFIQARSFKSDKAKYCITFSGIAAKDLPNVTQWGTSSTFAYAGDSLEDLKLAIDAWYKLKKGDK